MAEFNTKNQLRGKDGKWVFMGGSVKWFDPTTNTYVVGKIVKIEGDIVTVEREDGYTTEINKDNISTIASKASLTPEDEEENQDPQEDPVLDAEEIKDAPVGQEISVTLNGVKTHFKKTATDTWRYSEGEESSPDLNDEDFKFVVENGNVKRKSASKPVTAAIAPESDTVFGIVTQDEEVGPESTITALVKDDPDGTFYRSKGEWVPVDDEAPEIAGNWIEVIGDAVSIYDEFEDSQEITFERFSAVIVD